MLTSFADDDGLMDGLRGQTAKQDPLAGLTPQERRILERRVVITAKSPAQTTHLGPTLIT
jgi:hypothetical protein